MQKIAVNGVEYTVIECIFSSETVRGHATWCWHVLKGEKHYVIKDSWCLQSQKLEPDQCPSASMMPSSDVVDPKLTSPDAVASMAQPNKVDTSTPSAVEAVGNGSSVGPIIEPPLSAPESFIPPVSSYCSPPKKKKSSAILCPGPTVTAR